MKKICFLLLFINFFSFSKKLIDISSEFDKVVIKKITTNNEEFDIEVKGFLGERETIVELYKNKNFVSSKKYKYNENKEKILVYEKNSQKNVIEEKIYYNDGSIYQIFNFYPRGMPYGKKNEEFDQRVRFVLRRYNVNNEIIDDIAGEAPVVSGALFPAKFESLVNSKEFMKMMNLK